jgi:PAS domain S-box-containing protein
MLGYTRTELIGKTVLSMVAPDSQACVADAIQSGTEEPYAFNALRKDNTMFPVEVRGRKLSIGERELRLTSLRDITKQTRTQEAYIRERNLFRVLIDNLPDAIYVKDREGRKTVANPADVRNLGASSEEEVLGKNDFDFYPPEVATNFAADDQEVLRSGQPVLNREEYMFDAHGGKHWLLTAKLPLRDENNAIVGLVGIGRDITQQKEAQDALQKERNLLRTLIDMLPDYIYEKDTEGRFVAANLAVARRHGFQSPAELMGKTDHDLFPRQVADRFRAEEQTLLSSGNGIFDCEGQAIDATKEVKERWISTSKMPLKDANGKIIGYVGAGRDITERKRADAEREKLIQELQDALVDIKTLSGLVPICSTCKKIRDDKGFWTQVESFIQEHSQARFSHGICPDCMKKLYPEFIPKKKV